MKSFALFLTAVIATVSADDSCYYDVSMSCGPFSRNTELPTCNALYGAFRRSDRFPFGGSDYDLSEVVIRELQSYANLHIARSYDFLLSSIYFDNYETNRVGFAKLFRKLSDEAWGRSVGLIKHIVKRGGEMDFEYTSPSRTSASETQTVELHELGALAKALDVEKELAEVAFRIHREAARNRDSLHDAEITHYLEEEFIEKQADTIRNLAGHTTDVKRFVAQNKKNDMSLALHMFDTYLEKIIA